MIWKCFVLLYYGILKSMLNNNLTLFTQTKGVHGDFEELEDNVFNREKPYIYTFY